MSLIKDDQYIYQLSEINRKMINSCGNKAVNLAELYNNGFKVPMGFVISSELVKYVVEKKVYPLNFYQELQKAIHKLEEATNKKMGDPHNPLLVSVRSSGNLSMPGILDTVLNVGMNNNLLNNWTVEQGFKEELYNKNKVNNVTSPMDQLMNAIDLVVNSIYEERFQYYDIGERLKQNFTMGIVVQEMVFGNLNNNSYTGVVFTSLKNSEEISGEMLHKSQGDNIVGGKVTPVDVKCLPEDLYNHLTKVCNKIEEHFKYIQDIEFTIEDNQLYILQTRNAQLTHLEKFYVLERFVKRGLITKEDFFLLAPPLSQVKNKQIDYAHFNSTILGKGIGITESIVSGYIANNHNLVMQLHKENKPVIYVTEETNSDHMKSIMLASGLVTMKGGATSHAAVVARGRNMVCVLSLYGLEIVPNGIKVNGIFLENGSIITLDGNQGNLLEGKIESKEVINEIESTTWKLSPIKVKMNGETVEDMKNGHRFLMDGVGLCRLEHMLLTENGNFLIQKLLLNPNDKETETALETYLSKSFEDLFIHLKNLPITIRLLDPPLHEFLSTKELQEHNPMMGNRGVRLLISYPQLLNLQIRAIFNGYIHSDSHATLEIMVPFVFTLEELLYVKNVIKEIHTKYFTHVSYKFGIMIELPRAIFIADALSQEVDFIAFGTNDLTQMTLGLSRDDSTTILQTYIDKGIIQFDPFQKLDSIVCQLLAIAVEKARSVKPNISIGICGEQGAHEESLEFLASIGINYISCSPFRIEQVRFNLNRYFVNTQYKK